MSEWFCADESHRVRWPFEPVLVFQCRGLDLAVRTGPGSFLVTEKASGMVVPDAVGCRLFRSPAVAKKRVRSFLLGLSEAEYLQAVRRRDAHARQVASWPVEA